MDRAGALLIKIDVMVDIDEEPVLEYLETTRANLRGKDHRKTGRFLFFAKNPHYDACADRGLFFYDRLNLLRSRSSMTPCTTNKFS
jgi:hypothetical protein